MKYRYTFTFIFPIKYNSLWQLYKKSVASFWTAEEIDFSADKEDWSNLTKDEKYFIESVKKPLDKVVKGALTPMPPPPPPIRRPLFDQIHDGSRFAHFTEIQRNIHFLMLF